MSPLAQRVEQAIEYYANHNGMFLFQTGALGWALGSLAQTCGLLFNKKIDPKEKKFLIPQEIADGAANIGMFALITLPLMKGADWLCEQGKIVFDGVKKGSAKYNQLKVGLNVGASLVGAVIASNILTPIIRNKLGTIAQKSSLKATQGPHPQYDPFHQMLLQETGKIPMKMSNYITSAKSGMKI